MPVIRPSHSLDTISSHKQFCRCIFLKNSLCFLSFSAIAMPEIWLLRVELAVFGKEMSIRRACQKSSGKRIGNGLHKKLIRKNLFDREAMSRVFLQHLWDEVFGSGGESDMIWKWVVAHLNPIVGSFHIISLKRRSPHKTSIGNNSQTPNIHFVGMTHRLVVCITWLLLSRI